MRKNLFLIILAVLISGMVLSCENEQGDTGNTGNSGNTGDTGDSMPDEGNSGNSGDSMPDDDSGNTGDSGNSGVETCDCAGKTYEIPEQFDNISGWCMADEDADGIPNCIEVPNGTAVDTDEDGDSDYKDSESDGDGIPDEVECADLPCKDTDEDGTSDYRDYDSDEDGTSDYRDYDSDDDGILDSVECAEQPCVDSDEDTVADYIDSDSDEDGVADINEGTGDVDKDGTPNFLDDDSDGDGILDSAENGIADPPLDTDEDGEPDFLDKDSDNDGLTDLKETEIGTDPKLTDTDGDEVDDNTEYAAGSNPTVADPEWWEGKYYVILPYNNAGHEVRGLDFATDITKADILFLIDLSGSMSDEIDNLKTGIKNTLISSIKAKIPDVGFGITTFDDEDYSDKGHRVTQYITTSESTIKSSINNVNDGSGVDEVHTDAIYYSATGEAHGNVPAVNCSGKEGSIGGACFRTGALPIFIMMTDEVIQSNVKNSSQAVAAMNGIKSKFIGIDSSSNGTVKSGYNSISQGTVSVDGSGVQFYYKIPTNGTGLSTNVADGVSYLASNVPMLVNTNRESIANPQSVDVTQFIKSVTPIKRLVNGSTVLCPTECTAEAFQNVKPGTTVTFDIDFHNDFYEPTTTENTAFRAKINVFGEGSLVDAREVYIIVPGKKVTGPGD